MNEKDIIELLNEAKENKVSDADFLAKIKGIISEDVNGFACLDHHRELRTGFPEVIFGLGKTTEQLTAIFLRLKEKSPRVLATRVTKEQAEDVLKQIPTANYDELSRTLVYIADNDTPLLPKTGNPYIAVISAGTSDLAVAEEAAITAETMGYKVDRVYDVGVAGIHRLLNKHERLESARVLVVVAGMEGALASVVGGLVSAPIVAVPTSIGYGANFGGLSALLSMLNSCASGVTVTNIDNGFGGGYYAGIIIKNFVE